MTSKTLPTARPKSEVVTESRSKPKAAKTFKICLAASGGGHLRQLLQMLPAVDRHDFYFLTEATPLGQSVAKEHQTCFVPHLAVGQKKSVGIIKYYWAIFSNLIHTLLHFIKERPQVVITTGAGACYFTVLLAHFFKRKVIYIESIARVKSISTFGQHCANRADLYLVQWPSLKNEMPQATYCNPFMKSELEAQVKKDKICVTVGTVMPFDRLVKYVSNLKEQGVISEEVFAQIGDGAAVEPECDQIEFANSLQQDELNSHLGEARIAIVHGGSGSMLSAVAAGCVVIAMPREHARGEHYDDHQFELVGAFREQGLIIEVRDEDELAAAIVEARSRKPVSVKIDPEAYGRHFDSFLETCE